MFIITIKCETRRNRLIASQKLSILRCQNIRPVYTRSRLEKDLETVLHNKQDFIKYKKRNENNKVESFEICKKNLKCHDSREQKKEKPLKTWEMKVAEILKTKGTTQKSSTRWIVYTSNFLYNMHKSVSSNVFSLL